ncbi:MAG: MFS transporter, partial [Pseudomonadota bacterium]
FICFAALNLLGALLAFLYFNHRPTAKTGENQGSVLAAWADHARNRALLALLLIGFLLLFVFVATFTYASFVLASDRFALSQGMLGLVFLVFAPSILTTPFAAAAIARRGVSWTFQAGIGASIVGLALLVLPWLASFLLGLTLVAAGLFFAQSVATASIRNAVTHDQAAANGLYLACYYLGGLAGAVVVGQVFDLFGWTAAVTLMLGCVLLASVLSRVALRGSVQPALSS